MSRATRVFYLSYAPPVPTWGGSMAFYRHFCERDDFETMVATYRRGFPQELVSYSPVFLEQNKLLGRLCRTRLMPWIEGVMALGGMVSVPAAVREAAKKFRPDIVFTIAGTWHHSALMAQSLARESGVPLVASFNDWFNFGWFPAHPVFHSAVESRFRRFYREADLALCTCEGMQEELGAHPNAHVLYPIGAQAAAQSAPFVPSRPGTRPFVVVFAGSLSGWYGEMLERVVREARDGGAPVEFRIYGSGPSWSPEFDRLAKEQNIFRGHLPFEQLRREVQEADALLLPMGFGPESALIERTSFKTKFLDYLTYGKPILVWGPDYCSAVRAAREFGSAQICTSDNSRDALEGLLTLARSPERQMELVECAREMYEDRFHPEKIHRGLVEKIEALTARRKKAAQS